MCLAECTQGYAAFWVTVGFKQRQVVCQAVSEHPDRWCLSSSRFRAPLRIVCFKHCISPSLQPGWGRSALQQQKPRAEGRLGIAACFRRSCKWDRALRFFLHPREPKSEVRYAKPPPVLSPSLPDFPIPLGAPSRSPCPHSPPITITCSCRECCPPGPEPLRSPGAAALLRLQPPGPLPAPGAHPELRRFSPLPPPSPGGGRGRRPLPRGGETGLRAGAGRREGTEWRQGRVLQPGRRQPEAAPAAESWAGGREPSGCSALSALSPHTRTSSPSSFTWLRLPRCSILRPLRACSPPARVRALRFAGGAGRGWQHPRRADRERAPKESCISSPGLILSQFREVLLKTPAGSFGASPLPERRALAAAPPSAQHLTVLAPCGAMRRDCRVRHLCFIRLSLSTERGAGWAIGSRPAPCKSFSPTWGGGLESHIAS